MVEEDGRWGRGVEVREVREVSEASGRAKSRTRKWEEAAGRF